MKSFIDLVAGMYVYDLGDEYRLIVKVLLGQGLIRVMPHGLLCENSFDVNSLEMLEGVTKGRVHAIKMYKQRTSKSLKDSVEAIDGYFKKNGLNFYKHE